MRRIGPDVMTRRRPRLANPIGEARGPIGGGAGHMQTHGMSEPLGRLAVFQPPGRLAENAGRVAKAAESIGPAASSLVRLTRRGLALDQRFEQFLVQYTANEIFVQRSPRLIDGSRCPYFTVINRDSAAKVASRLR
jgi:hypothetical protein